MLTEWTVAFFTKWHRCNSVLAIEKYQIVVELKFKMSQNGQFVQALFWSAHRRISVNFPQIFRPLLDQYKSAKIMNLYMKKGQNSPKSAQNGPFQPLECSVRTTPVRYVFNFCSVTRGCFSN